MTEIGLSDGGKFVYQSPAMQAVIDRVDDFADSKLNILITGDNGAGKEKIARLIHDKSKLANEPFHAINCAAISASLIESELFGHEAGSFTGAKTAKKGIFETANGGTLFLDEIGEMSPDLQSKLLRVIQDGKFQRVGGNKDIIARPRIIAATNRNIDAALEQGDFRHDIYHRIAQVVIHIPDLKERVEDIPLLAGYFARKAAKDAGHDAPVFSDEATDALKKYDWPGNVRELENAVNRAVIRANKRKSGVITPEFLELGKTAAPEFAAVERIDLGLILTRSGKVQKNKIATQSGINRTTLHKFLGEDHEPSTAERLAYFVQRNYGKAEAHNFFDALMQRVEEYEEKKLGSFRSPLPV